MIDILTNDLKASFPKPKYHLQFTHKYLMVFTDLTSSRQKLLLAMINNLELTYKPESYIGTADYKTFGYDHRQNYYKDKKALEKAGFILTDGKQYVVRLAAVFYTSKRGYDNLCKTTGVMFDPFGGFGGNIPTPPPLD